MDITEITQRLQGWACEAIGSDTTVSAVEPMPGNSGFSFGFDVGHGPVTQRLVIRMPPPGAAPTRNSDVLRQARILRAMAEAGVPVPAVPWAGDGSAWFDAPYYVAEFVGGRSTHLFDVRHAAKEDGVGLREVFDDGMRVLARIHEVDWRAKLPDWSEPMELSEEIQQWQPTLAKARDAAWIETGTALGELLMLARPNSATTTVVHGDYYSNNWLFDAGRVTAVLDWEIATIGSPALDLGWVMMMYDRPAWGPARHQWSAWSPTPESLYDAYVAAGGADHDDLDWYRALACYRLGCITGRAYALHVSGKRRDPAWEILADAFPSLMRRGFELLGARPPR